MRFRLMIFAGALGLAGALYYAASPMIAAYKLREAVRSSDSRALETMIDWPALRQSIKQTVARNAELLPAATDVAQSMPPTLWQRMRSVFGHSLLDRFIENYITPAGLPKLYRARQKWHGSTPRPAFAEASLIPSKVADIWRRIKRAEFVGFSRFVLEIEDRHRATRLIESTFELSRIGVAGIRWKLVTVSIRNQTPPKVRLSRLNGF